MAWYLIVIPVALIFNLIISGIIAKAASERGRSGFLFFIISFLSSPIMAGFLLLVLGESKSKKQYSYGNPEYNESLYRTSSSSSSSENHCVSSVYSTTMLDRFVKGNDPVSDTWTCCKCGCSTNTSASLTCKDCGEYK